MISSQKEREFTGMNYDDIEPVYSIWICMNMQENSMCHIHLVQDDLIDAKQWKGDLDIPNIIMIGLGKEIQSRMKNTNCIVCLAHCCRKNYLQKKNCNGSVRSMIFLLREIM